MVKKVFVPIGILGILNISVVIFMLLCEYDRFRYKNFDFNTPVFFLNILLLLLVDSIVGLLLFFLLKKRFDIFAVLLPVTLFVCWASICLSLCVTMGAFWHSETDNFEEFYGADEQLNKNLRVAGITIDDITKMEILDVEDFYYFNESILAVESFVFNGSFKFSEKDYKEIQAAFENSNEFVKNTYSETEQESTGMTGYYSLDPSVPGFKTKTTVDKWEMLNITFCDNSFKIAFELSGDCYT